MNSSNSLVYLVIISFLARLANYIFHINSYLCNKFLGL